MEKRTLLFWSKSNEKIIDRQLWNCDRIIEIPDDITMDNYKVVATKLSPIVFEEISKSIEEKKQLSIIQLTNHGFPDILLKILENLLVPSGGELLNLKIAKKKDNGPTVVIDDAAAAESIAKKKVVDFDQEPLPDSSIFKDSYKNTLEPPANWKRDRLGSNDLIEDAEDIN